MSDSSPETNTKSSKRTVVLDSEDDAEDDDVYTVERIVDYRKEKGIHKYRIKWKGYSSSDNTWEPLENVKDCAEMIRDFWKKTRKPRPLDTATHDMIKEEKPQPQGNEETREREQPPEDEVAESWDHLIDAIEAVEMGTSATASDMIVTIRWKNGRREQHKASVMYSKCPQMAIQFFAQHLDLPSP